MNPKRGVIRKYVELALREKIKEVRPDYGPAVTQTVVEASMKNLDVTKDVLLNAIYLAAQGEKP